MGVENFIERPICEALQTALHDMGGLEGRVLSVYAVLRCTLNAK